MEKLTALRVFRRVAELGSFTRAAADLRISNAAASKNVRELEEELGVPLVLRTTRRLNLTPAGQGYYERVVTVLDELANADSSVKDLRATPSGVVRVSAPMSFGLTSLMPVVADFLLRWPEIHVDVALDDRFVDPVREGFDVCIRGGGTLDDSTLVARKIGSLDRVLVAAPSYLGRDARPPLRTPADLARHPCLVYSISSAPDAWTFRKGPKTVRVDVRGPLRVNNSLALARAAAAGAGVALVPRFAVERELAAGRLVGLLEPWRAERQALYAIMPRHRESTRGVRLFVDHLVASRAASDA